MDRAPSEHVVVQPLAAWSDEDVSRAYRLLAGDVRAQLARGDVDLAELAATRAEAEAYGAEALGRGLLG